MPKTSGKILKIQQLKRLSYCVVMGCKYIKIKICIYSALIAIEQLGLLLTNNVSCDEGYFRVHIWSIAHERKT